LTVKRGILEDAGIILRALACTDYFTGLVVNLTSNAALVWLRLAIAPGGGEIWVPANLSFVGAGLLVPGLSRFLVFKRLGRPGSSITATVVNSQPMFSILLAVAFLGERPTLTNLLAALSAALLPGHRRPEFWGEPLHVLEQVTPRKIGAALLVVLGVLLISWEKL
jgi:drug/metabolite transporter (DMT)-like permease